jgi:hypothetical protein
MFAMIEAAPVQDLRIQRFVPKLKSIVHEALLKNA